MSQRFNFFKKKKLHFCEYENIHNLVKDFRKRKFIGISLGVSVLSLVFLITWYESYIFSGLGLFVAFLYILYLGIILYVFLTIVIVCNQNYSYNSRKVVAEIVYHIEDGNISSTILDTVDQISTSNSSSVSVQTIIPVVGLPIMASFVNYVLPLDAMWITNIIAFVLTIILGFVAYYDAAYVDTLIKEAVIRVRGDRSIEKAKVLALADESRLRRLLETVPKK